jgi:hypothetical protein
MKVRTRLSWRPALKSAGRREYARAVERKPLQPGLIDVERFLRHAFSEWELSHPEDGKPISYAN